MIQSLISRLLLSVTALFAGIGLLSLALTIQRSNLPYNSEGNYFDGVVNYHEQNVFLYGIFAAVSFLAAGTLFAIRLFVGRIWSKTG